MNFARRLRAMFGLGKSTDRVSVHTRNAAVAMDEEARLIRLGDVDGQTRRARRYSASLDARVKGGK